MIRKLRTPRSPSTYLLSGDAHVVPHVGEDSGLEEEAFHTQSFASTLQLGSFTDATLDKLQHPILLLPTDLQGKRTDMKRELSKNKNTLKLGEKKSEKRTSAVPV